MPEPQRRFTVSAGTSIGTPGLEPDVPRAVDRVGARLQHVAEDDVIDPLRLDAAFAPAPRAPRSRPARSPTVLQRAGVVGHRRARAADDEDFSHRHHFRATLITKHESRSSVIVSVPRAHACAVTIALAMQSPVSRVPSEPPISVVHLSARRPPSAPPLRSPRPRRSSPSVSSISAADRIAPIGFATFLPASGGAEPCTGSNIDVLPGMEVARRRHARGRPGAPRRGR